MIFIRDAPPHVNTGLGCSHLRSFTPSHEPIVAPPSPCGDGAHARLHSRRPVCPTRTTAAAPLWYGATSRSAAAPQCAWRLSGLSCRLAHGRRWVGRSGWSKHSGIAGIATFGRTASVLSRPSKLACKPAAATDGRWSITSTALKVTTRIDSRGTWRRRAPSYRRLDRHRIHSQRACSLS